MILDDLENAGSYSCLGPRFERAFEYLRTSDLTATADGRHAIDGEEIAAIVQSYSTKPVEEGRWEAHRKYADIQYVVSGVELVGVAQLHTMEVTEDYDGDGDVAFFAGTGQRFVLAAGQFAIFLPQDVHMPGLILERPQTVRKVVMKVRL